MEALEWATDHVQWHLVELGLCYSARLFVRIPPTFQKPHRGLYPRPDPTGRGIGVHRAGSLWMGPWMYSVEVSTDVPYRAVGCTVETRHIVTEHCFDHYTHAEHCWGQPFSLQSTVSIITLMQNTAEGKFSRYRTLFRPKLYCARLRWNWRISHQPLQNLMGRLVAMANIP